MFTTMAASPVSAQASGSVVSSFVVLVCNGCDWSCCDALLHWFLVFVHLRIVGRVEMARSRMRVPAPHLSCCCSFCPCVASPSHKRLPTAAHAFPMRLFHICIANQHPTPNATTTSRVLFHQLCLRGFGDMSCLSLTPPAPVHDLVLAALDRSAPEQRGWGEERGCNGGSCVWVCV